MLTPMTTVIAQSNIDKIKNVLVDTTLSSEDSGRKTEYWAVLCAVGEYLNHPEQNRPSMLEAVNLMKTILLQSSNWQEDHIHMLKGEQATGKNLIRELLWLIRKEGRNDYSLVYITTHGFPLKNDAGKVDLWPKDEADGADEALVMYAGFEKWYAIIWDDLLNFFLSLLQSKGVCVIIDSCYAGGFNDDPFLAGGIDDLGFVEQFDVGFSKELAHDNRVVLMSCEEHSVSYGSFFSNFISEGFMGFADLNGNMDGINSAEEAFLYAKPRVEWWTYWYQSPTMLDLFDGEMPITYT
ncbi:MAG: caspase family protein [Candidatus Thermoplasmatota archaeon]|nr:caspase family protein [Candidatus Thermoplasmatota archaeon]MBU1941594.1 caspase family protein [Candidatus Thermoplasmatota archaeon]